MSDPLEPLPFDQIVQAMADQFTAYQIATDMPLTDLSEGSVVRSLMEAVAAPLEDLMLRFTVDLPGQYFLDQASGEALDRLIGSFTFGLLTRIPAATAAGTLALVGIPGAVTSANIQARTVDGWRVKLLAPVTLAVGQTRATLAATALRTGAAGNLPKGTRLTLDPPVAGVSYLEVETAWAGGSDQQSDADFLASLITWLGSLARATRPALLVGAQAAGYQWAYVAETGGAVKLYLDDGGPASETKIAEAQALIAREWKAAGVYLRALPRVEHPITLVAEAFSSPTATKAEMEARILAAWQAVFDAKRMGDPVSRLELLAAAASAPGFNGVNLENPDYALRAALDEYGAAFGDGDLYPYERPVLAGVDWR